MLHISFRRKCAAHKSKSLFLLLFSKMIPISHRNNPDCPEYDEYIPGEKREPIGLYKLTHDDEGNPIIEFDDPMKADNVSPQEAEDPSKEAAPAKGKPGRKAETCTTNTDKVDREIEKLKEERDQLEQQIRTTKEPG